MQLYCIKLYFILKSNYGNCHVSVAKTSWCQLLVETYPIHLVDNHGIGVGEISSSGMGSTDNGEVVQVFGDESESAAGAEGSGSVMHKRTVIVRHAKVGGTADLVEVVSEKG